MTETPAAPPPCPDDGPTPGPAMREMTEEEVIANAERELAALGQGFLQTPTPAPAPRGPAVRLILELDHMAAGAALAVAGLGMAVSGGLDISKLLAPVLEGMAAGIGPKPGSGGKPPDPSSRFLGMLSDLMKSQVGAATAGNGCGRCQNGTKSAGGSTGSEELEKTAGAHFMAIARSLAVLTVASQTDLARLNSLHHLLAVSEIASRAPEGYMLLGRGGAILGALHCNSAEAPALIDRLLVTLLGAGALPGKGDEIQASWNKYGGRTPPPEEGYPIRGIDQPTFFARMKGPFVKVDRVSLVTDEAAGTDTLIVAYQEVGFPIEETMILPRGAGDGVASSLWFKAGSEGSYMVEVAKV